MSEKNSYPLLQMIHRSQIVAVVLLSIAAGPCAADIWAYVDENGRSHFSDVQLDSRYELYMKSRPVTPSDESTNDASQSPDSSAPQAAASVWTNKRYADMIARVAREQKIEAALLHAVIAAESAYNPNAKSPKGAIGLMQVMPDTAKRYGITDLLNPLQNLRAGARYLRDLLALFDNNLRLVLAAYNAGEGAVMRSGNAIPPFPETRAYVPRVLQYYESYRARLRGL